MCGTRKVRPVALAADGEVAILAPHLVEHFVQDGVQRFGFDNFDSAIAWATGNQGRRKG